MLVYQAILDRINEIYYILFTRPPVQPRYVVVIMVMLTYLLLLFLLLQEIRNNCRKNEKHHFNSKFKNNRTVIACIKSKD